ARSSSAFVSPLSTVRGTATPALANAAAACSSQASGWGTTSRGSFRPAKTKAPQVRAAVRESREVITGRCRSTGPPEVWARSAPGVPGAGVSQPRPGAWGLRGSTSLEPGVGGEERRDEFASKPTAKDVEPAKLTTKHRA